MEKSIGIAKKIIDMQVKDYYINQSNEFLRENKIYSWTNENMKSYLSPFNYNNIQKALTVLSSGDHAFNLLSLGIKDIDTFDINPLTEYYALGLKRAMILKYDYKTFISILNFFYNPFSSLTIITELVHSLLPYMEKKYQIFWQIILDYNYGLQKETGTHFNLILLLTLDTRGVNPLYFNTYLNSEKEYNNLRRSLINANITFKNVNAINLGQSYKDNKYDYILLSNILDYFHYNFGSNWCYEQLLNYEKELEKIAKRDALIFLHYIICYKKDGEIYRKSIIDRSSISFLDLVSEEIIEVPSNASISCGLILKKCK